MGVAVVQVSTEAADSRLSSIRSEQRPVAQASNPCSQRAAPESFGASTSSVDATRCSSQLPIPVFEQNGPSASFAITADAKCASVIPQNLPARTELALVRVPRHDGRHDGHD